MSARHGLAWYEFDINWITLEAAATRVGIVWDVKVAKVAARLPAKKPRSSSLDDAEC